jgi:hypothetical protein
MARPRLTKTVRIKWAVMTDEKYVSGPGGKIAWTYDRKEAEKTAKVVGGRVVDADKLSSAAWRAKHVTNRLRRRARSKVSSR